MRLTVVSVAYPFAPVGPDAVGGAEQVLSHLDRALVRNGHRSVVVACRGSSAAGELVETPALEVLDAGACAAVRRECGRRLREVVERERPDVVHMHGLDWSEYLPPPGAPTLVTLHLPPAWYPAGSLTLSRPRTFMHCVSASQRRACGDLPGLLPEIENGIDVGGMRVRCGKRGYALAMGRVCPEKNLHAAIGAAAAAGCPVVLAGRVFPYESHERYFREEIVPRLGAGRRFIGPVGGRRKARLLWGARCVLIPSLAAESSSLVAMEAAACGTPVIAYRSGALPEIVEDGVTGFLVDDERGMAAAIAKADRIDPEACREAARRRFGVERMVARYFEVYRLISGRPERSAPVVPSARAAAVERVRMEEITTLAGLERLRPEWSDLWMRDPGATAFHSPEWLIPWWRHLGRGELMTLAVRDGAGGLVGLAPLYVREAEGGRRVLPIGIGTTDYLDGLFDPAWAAAAGRAVIEHLGRGQGRWDAVELPQLREGSALQRASPPRGWRDRRGRGEACPALTLESCGDGLPAGVPAAMSGNLRYYQRRAARAGATIEPADERGVEEVFGALVRLHRERWEARGMRGVLDDPAVQRAHLESLPGLSRAGMLRLYALRVAGETVAVLYALADPRPGGRTCYYIGGFSPSHAALSPGTLLIGHAVREACREGAGVLDFLRGREPYKYLWGATDVLTHHRLLRPGCCVPARRRGWRDAARR